MDELFIEHRPQSGKGISGDIAGHMLGRMSGHVAIIHDRPQAFLGNFKKHWFKLARSVQRERSSTLNLARITELSEMAARMITLEFTTNPNNYLADVQILTVEQAAQTAPAGVATIYVTTPATKQQLRFITALLLTGSLVVIYRPPKSGESDK